MNKKRNYLSLAVQIAILGASTQAVYAQTDESAKVEESSARVIEVIEVTATKRTQNLQDVPITVTAVTGSELKARNISETSDLMGSMPNLQVTSAYSKTQPNFSIRGISVANEFSASTASPVGVYVDEVFQTFRAAHGQQLFDLSQLEVLRGPQGTLFGRNTTGGAITITTAKPTLDEGSSGFVTVGAGNFDSQALTGAFEHTLIADELGFRIAATKQKMDGYTFNPVDSQYYGETDSEAVRFSVKWKPIDNLEIDFKAYTAENQGLGDLAYGIGYFPGQTNVLGAPTRNSLLPGESGRRLNENEVESNEENSYRTSSDGLSLTASYTWQDFTLTSITGFDKADFSLNPYDCDGTVLDLCGIRYFSESESFNQDLRLTYANDRFSVVAGIYFGTEEVVTENEPDFFGLLDELLPADLFNPVVGVIDPSNPALGVIPADGNCSPLNINSNGFLDARTFFEFVGLTSGCAAVGAPPFTSILGNQQFTIERPSQAIYGEISYNVTEKFNVTLGMRYTQDDVEFNNARTVLFDEAGNIRASTIPYSFPADLSLARVSQSEDSNELTGRAIASYDLNESSMTFFSYSRGYRAGTFNGLAYQDINQVFFIEPESIDAFEIGYKSRWLENRLQINAAAFMYDYKNQQVAEIVGTTSFLRAADGELSGLEIEVTALPTDDVKIRSSFGLINSEYDEGQRFTPNGVLVGGNNFPNAPDVTFNLGVDWNIMEIKGGFVDFTIDAQYMGEYNFDPFGNYGGNYPGGSADVGSGYLASKELAEGNPAYWLLNGRLTYATENYTISVWAKNITDRFYNTYGLNLNAFGQDYLARGLPRTFGVEFTYNFY
jgi:iron complex outermembrane receptor protein